MRKELSSFISSFVTFGDEIAVEDVPIAIYDADDALTLENDIRAADNIWYGIED